MVIFQAIHALLNLDIGFFIDVIMGNVIWVFGFYVLAYAFFHGKNTTLNFVLFSIYLWAFLSFVGLWNFATAGVDLFLFFIFEVIAFHFINETKFFGKHNMMVQVVAVYILLIWFTFFLRG